MRKWANRLFLKELVFQCRIFLKGFVFQCRIFLKELVFQCRILSKGFVFKCRILSKSLCWNVGYCQKGFDWNSFGSWSCQTLPRLFVFLGTRMTFSKEFFLKIFMCILVCRNWICTLPGKVCQRGRDIWGCWKSLA